MKTWKEIIKDVVTDAFLILDHSEYEDAFTPELEAEAIEDTTAELVKMLPAEISPDDDAPADYGIVNIGYFERLADEAAERFEIECVERYEALHAEQIELTPEEKRELKLARMGFFDPIEEAEIHS